MTRIRTGTQYIRWATGLVLLFILMPLTGAHTLDEPVSASGQAKELSRILPTVQLSPTPGRPVLVLAGIHIHEVTNISLRDQLFTVLLTLNLQWNDPRLSQAFNPDNNNTRKTYEGDAAHEVLSHIWQPPVILYNALLGGVRDYYVTVYRGGLVNLKILESVTVRYDAKLRAFPFDVQTLRLVLTAFDERDDTFRIQPLSFSQSKSEASIVPIDYELVETSLQFENMQTSASGFQQALVFTLKVARQSNYYICRYFVPISALLFIAWTTLFYVGYRISRSAESHRYFSAHLRNLLVVPESRPPACPLCNGARHLLRALRTAASSRGGRVHVCHQADKGKQARRRNPRGTLLGQAFSDAVARDYHFRDTSHNRITLTCEQDNIEGALWC